jgi:hypothetical protein
MCCRRLAIAATSHPFLCMCVCLPPPSPLSLSLQCLHTHTIVTLQDQWRSFFSHRGYGGTNALVWSNEWMMTSSTTGQLAHVLFRIRNNNPTTSISWTLFFYYTSYSGWGEFSQIIVNGVEVRALQSLLMLFKLLLLTLVVAALLTFGVAAMC